ncbi:MAG: alpha/beta hydrolase [Candidatus Bipolaricaulota bacterium]|nr:alpha/beta hydrolase [Candidatus Bipolaricaulota bacterium]
MRRVLVLGMALGLVFWAPGLRGEAPTYRVFPDIPYARIPGFDLRLTSLDLYVPLGGTGHPVVVWVHGGGWRGGDKGNLGEKPGAFTGAGYVLVSVNYRLSPAVQHPAHVQDVAAAIAWVRANIAAYGGDPQRIFLIGHSAGAHLVALVATDGAYLEAHGLGLNALSGVVCLDGAGYDIPDQVKRGILPALLYRQAFGDDPEVWWQASPLAHVTPGKGIPPFFLVYAGDRAASREESQELAEALREAGVRVELYHAADKDHAGVNQDLGKPGDELTARVFAFLEGLASPGGQGELPAQVLRDLAYARVGGKSLRLDLHLPRRAEGARIPVVVWIHGGGWRGGDKAGTPAPEVLGEGYAVASINYRLSPEAPFPAQIHDCKAAVRWLRAHADRYGLDPDRIGVWGSSAGGHLAALLGTSGGVAELEGAVGEHLDQESRVQAVCDFFGPADLLALLEPGAWSAPTALSAVSLLLGGPVAERVELARLASPVAHVSPDDPPFLIVHGDRDATVPLDQSERLHRALTASGVSSTLHVVRGAGHGIPELRRDPAVDPLIRAFFDRHLRGQ